MKCDLTSKIIYDSEEEALKKAEQITKFSDIELTAYICPYYKHWHLTKMSKNVRKKVHKKFQQKQQKRKSSC